MNLHRYPNGTLTLGYGAGATVATLTLDSNFVYDNNTGIDGLGDCLGVRFCSPVSDTIDDILFYLPVAPGSAHDLTIKVAAWGATLSRPGLVLTNGTLAVSGGATSAKWIKATFTSKPTVVAGTYYWIVIGDPVGLDTGGYTILAKGTGPAANANAIGNFFTGYTSADGFKTNGTAATCPPCCIHFTNGEYLGQPYTAAAVNFSTATAERGWKFQPTEDITLCGVYSYALVAGNLKVYEGEDTQPGGTIFSGFNGGAALAIGASHVATGYIAFAPCTLTGGNIYRIVVDPTSTTTAPGYTDIEDYTTHAAILDACSLYGAAGMQYTTEVAGPDWLELAYRFIRMALIFGDNPAQAPSGNVKTIQGVTVSGIDAIGA